MRYRYFTDNELACKCGCGRQEMDPSFMFKVDELRERAGFPLRISSAYRCSEHNRNVSSTGPYGPHTTGRAIDFKLSHAQALHVVAIAVALGFTGVGVQQKGSGRFIHLDDLSATPRRPRPHIWSY